MSKSAKSSKSRKVRLICKCCGGEWLTEDLNEIEYSKRQAPTCGPCIYLGMARRCAHRDNLSLRQAVRRFIKGVHRMTHESPNTIWRGKV